jgi:raffinose/stachyose/melibiose transport system permease protein
MASSTPLSSSVQAAGQRYAPQVRHHGLDALGRWAFVCPVLILNLIVIIIPSVAAVYIAFTHWSGYGVPEFIGLENVQTLLKDPVFFKALTNNLVWTAMFLTIPVAMGLLGAYLLAGIKRGQTLYRIIFFIPYVVASVVNAQLWRYLFDPRFGIGVVLSQYGITFLDTPVLGNRATALFAVAFVDGWHFWGFLVVVYLSAMVAVDPELYEVARLDGASRFQQFRFVTLPSIRPTLVFTLLMITIWSSLVFDYIYILTGGGPARASEVMGTYLYDTAFKRFDVGYAAAIGLVMSVWVALAVGIFVYLRRRGWQI